MMSCMVVPCRPLASKQSRAASNTCRRRPSLCSTVTFGTRAPGGPRRSGRGSTLGHDGLGPRRTDHPPRRSTGRRPRRSPARSGTVPHRADAIKGPCPPPARHLSSSAPPRGNERSPSSTRIDVGGHEAFPPDAVQVTHRGERRVDGGRGGGSWSTPPPHDGRRRAIEARGVERRSQVVGFEVDADVRDRVDGTIARFDPGRLVACVAG